MPKSKKRTPKAKTTRPRSGRPTPKPAPIPILAATARERFITLATTEGHLFPAIKGYEPYGPPVECWTNAWTYAQATGLGYAEGIALMPNGWHAHAWCVTDDGAVIEPTLGYDHATEYRGWCLHTDQVAALRSMQTLGPDDPATSVLEAGLGSGVATWEQIRDRFTYIPGTI